MDPVTGLGLAASVIQVVTFGIDAAKTIREVYQEGSASRHDHLRDTTNHLESLTQLLQQSLQNASRPHSRLSKDERDLLDLGRKCEDCARNLQRELQKLQSETHGSIWKATRIALRSIRKGLKIEEIEKQLRTYQFTLETSLLYHLRYGFPALGANETYPTNQPF